MLLRLPVFFLLGTIAALRAQSPTSGAILGLVLDGVTKRPAEYVALTAKRAADGQTVRSTVTDRNGRFAIEPVPFGDYIVVYGAVGGDLQRTSPFAVDAAHRSFDLGPLTISTGGPIQLEKVEISGRREAFYNSIDRKVYNVGRDLRSTSGSASDLLQNVPSVQVDIEGNVSLRGNGNVLILVNGKPSTLMSTTNRADVLAQMPADAIDRIEVITNPSAKYKPDGTAGIINIVEKRKHDAGFSGTWRVSFGNDRRMNAGWSANYNPGKYNVFANASVRQDDRPRYSHDMRQHLDTATNSTVTTEQASTELMRPLSRLVQIGGDCAVNDRDKVSAAGSYNYRTFFRNSTIANLSRAADGSIATDYDRRRTDPEWQKTVELSVGYEHSFAEEGHDLAVELKRDRHWEQEDNHYANVYRMPAAPTALDFTLIKPTETGTEIRADYVHPLPDDAKLEAGYAGETNKNDMDFRAGRYDPIGNNWLDDATRTNRFIYHDWIHALYATYGQPIGRFGFLAGLRLERTTVNSDQVTVHLIDRMQYVRLYPTLHLSYRLTEASQLQLNYSRRVHRPESEDLNPFPEYQDPFNLRAGNPKLRPEETHSIEAGYQYRQEGTSYLGALFFRQTDHAFTTVTRYLDAVTLLTTHDNLASNRSGGIELAATRNLGSHVALNFSSNAFYNEIDASNLGVAGNRSTIAWDAKLNVDWHATKADLIQLNANYSAKRLTAQGYRQPTYLVNLGWKHELADKRTAFVLTVSDLFNSLKERTVIDTPALHDDTTRRRSSRIVFAGLIYTFGRPAKKKDDTLQFDNQL